MECLFPYCVVAVHRLFVLQVGRDLIEAVHGHLVAHEAAGVGGEGPEHDGHGAAVQRARAILLHQRGEDVSHPVESALGSCEKLINLESSVELHCVWLREKVTTALQIKTDTLVLPIVCSESLPVCSLLLSTSGGMATIQLKMPAMPPAKSVRPMPSWVRSPPSGTKARWIIS